MIDAYGNTSLNRFHILDDIPFEKQLRFDMENWHWNERVKVTRAATSYWYARPGCTDDYKPISREDLQLVNVPIFGTPGVMEGEDLLILSSDGGTAPLYDDERYSAETYLRWLVGTTDSVRIFGGPGAVSTDVECRVNSIFDPTVECVLPVASLVLTHEHGWSCDYVKRNNLATAKAEVRDQNGEPVVGVSVTFTWGLYSGTVSQTVVTVTLA